MEAPAPLLPSPAPLQQILAKMEEAPNKSNTVVILTNDVFVLMLSRLNARSLCSYNCVCYSCNRLISDSKYHKELPQIVAEFFYRTWRGKRHFASFRGEGPSLSFLPFPINDIIVSDCCSGLILYWCAGCSYVVRNPATKKWSLLPENLSSCGEGCLGLDPTVSLHFFVFEYGKMRKGESVGVSIYSSKTDACIFKESKRGNDIIVSTYVRSVFLNGFMHWQKFSQIVATDMEGKHG